MTMLVGLDVILLREKLIRPEASELAQLAHIDARIVPVFTGTIDLLSADKKVVLNGFCARIRQIDDKLEAYGHPEFKTHPRLSGALGWFESPATTVEMIMTPNEALGNKSPLAAFDEIRRSLWTSIPV